MSKSNFILLINKSEKLNKGKSLINWHKNENIRVSKIKGVQELNIDYILEIEGGRVAWYMYLASPMGVYIADRFLVVVEQ